MDQKWFKYTHVCHTCDALIEHTSTRYVIDITCECGGTTGQLSMADATISQLIKGEQMETMTMEDLTKENGSLKVTLDDTMKHVEYQRNKINELQSQVNRIIDNLTEDYWFNPNTDSETILSDICDILDHQPVKEISFTATIVVEGRANVPLGEDFNLEDIEFSVDAHSGDVVIDNDYIDRIEEN